MLVREVEELIVDWDVLIGWLERGLRTGKAGDRDRPRPRLGPVPDPYRAQAPPGVYDAGSTVPILWMLGDGARPTARLAG
jgi:hypothetical protein